MQKKGGTRFAASSNAMRPHPRTRRKRISPALRSVLAWVRIPNLIGVTQGELRGYGMPYPHREWQKPLQRRQGEPDCTSKYRGAPSAIALDERSQNPWDAVSPTFNRWVNTAKR